MPSCTQVQFPPDTPVHGVAVVPPALVAQMNSRIRCPEAAGSSEMVAVWDWSALPTAANVTSGHLPGLAGCSFFLITAMP